MSAKAETLRRDPQAGHHREVDNGIRKRCGCLRSGDRQQQAADQGGRRGAVLA